MAELLPCAVVDEAVLRRTVERFGRAASCCPRSPSWRTPSAAPTASAASTTVVDPDAADPRNLFRVHWYNDARRGTGRVDVPDHVVLPVADRSRRPDHRGDRRPFPMIGAHKVLAAYACLGPDWSPAGSTPRATGRCGPPPATTPGAAWPSAHHGLPGRGRAAGGHEPGALRLARPWVADPGRRHPHAGHREQRQGDLRRLRGAGRGPGERDLQPVLRVRQPPRPPAR